MRQLGLDVSLQFAFALLMTIALIALPLTIAVTAGVIRLFRRQVERSMRATALPVPPEAQRDPPGASRTGLQLEEIETSRARARATHALPLVAEIERRGRRLAATYAAAAGAYPLLLAAAWIAATESAPDRNVVLAFAPFYGLLLIVFSTPVALAVAVVLKRQPGRLLLAAAAPVAVLWLWDWSAGTNLSRLWLLAAAVPTGAVLLLNTRRLRAIGPVVFTATLLLLYGVAAGHFYAALHALDAIGPLHFVREDLAALPVREAGQRWLAWLWSLPPEQRLAEISALAAEPFAVIQPANPEGVTAAVKATFFAIWLAGTAVGVAAAWAFVRWLARSYRARRASDQMLAIDVLMLIFVLPILLLHLDRSRWFIAAGALAALAGYRLLAGWGLHRRRQAAPPAPRTLLLLRVFGNDRRTQRLLEDLGRRWRHLGPIRLIGGTDAASATIEPFEFFEFLNGRLSRAFIKDRRDLESRLAASAAIPDPDGLYRIEDFFCHDDTWRITVARLARDAAAVLMDLRGFAPANRGCIFEIEELVATVPLQRIVLLVDASTDLAFLEQTLHGAWRAVPEDSLNAAPGEHRLRILQAARRQGPTLATLLGLLCESATPAPRPVAEAAS